MSRARLTVIAAAVLLAGSGAGCGSDDDERVDASAPDFAVELPAGWEARDEEDREEVGEFGLDFASDQLGLPDGAPVSFDVQALWTETEVVDEFRTNINVIREQLPAGISPQRYLELSASQIEATAAFTDVSEITDGPEVDGEPSSQLTYSAGQGPPVRLRLVTVFHGDAAYNVTLTSLEDRFAEAEADLGEIVGSWSWD